MKSFSFDAEEGGDGESFLWRVSPSVRRAIIGSEAFDNEVQINEEIAAEDGLGKPPLPAYLYPGELLTAMGCKQGKKYRFAISAEELP